MKIRQHLKRIALKSQRGVLMTTAGLASLFAWGTGFADTAITMAQLQANISSTMSYTLKIVMTIITIAGILLVIRGIVHLKQNYTGTGQEKHLSKGLASLGFGTALFMAVPFAHMLVEGVGGGTTYDTWSTGTSGTAQDLTPAAAGK